MENYIGGRSPDLLHNDHDFSKRHMSKKFDKDLLRWLFFKNKSPCFPQNSLYEKQQRVKLENKE